MNIPIVYEDDWLLVANKPAGLLSVPTPKNESRTLTSILNQDVKERNLSYRLYPCHRLDRQTSGLIIYAKSKNMEDRITDLFRNRLVSKKYIAFVQGKLPAKQGVINFSIEGKNATTKYNVTGIKSNYSIVEVSPLTGRTNQIRIHFKGVHHPVVGEDKFAFRKDFVLKTKRLMLHASSLEFKHPQTGKAVDIKIPLAEDMQRFLDGHS